MWRMTGYLDIALSITYTPATESATSSEACPNWPFGLTARLVNAIILTDGRQRRPFGCDAGFDQSLFFCFSRVAGGR